MLFAFAWTEQMNPFSSTVTTVMFLYFSSASNTIQLALPRRKVQKIQADASNHLDH